MVLDHETISKHFIALNFIALFMLLDYRYHSSFIFLIFLLYLIFAGKATVITIRGHIAGGAVVGSVVENWLR